MGSLNLHLSKWQIISLAGVLILLVGLIVGVYLVKRQQITKTRAAVDLSNALEIRDADNNLLTCTPASGTTPMTCTTSTLNIKLKVTNPNALVP